MSEPRAIAFYLPQYHPTPENDEWWGTGFTEWRNVSKAKPLFPGHYQPRLPADLGFYDLRVPEVREAQAALARKAGIHGFCYYHYWFNGRRILERPFNDVLASGQPDFPFCLCWANENWTRAWDGGEREVLLGQGHSKEDDVRHIRSLVSAFLDPRYIRIDGKPLFLVYRTEELPDPAATAAIWRKECRDAGVGEIYLARVESFAGNLNPSDIGFDAAVEFAPDWRTLKQFLFRTPMFQRACKWGLLPQTYLTQYITHYDLLIERMIGKPVPAWTRFRCATPGFDNSSRRADKGAAIYVGCTPEKYERWLAYLAADAVTRHPGDHKVLFINAWNEWAEGNHLEPDRLNGHAYLDATLRALQVPAVGATGKQVHTTISAIEPQSLWWRVRRKLRRTYEEAREVWRHVKYWRSRRQLDDENF